MTLIEKFSELKTLNQTQILNRMKLTSKLKDGKIAMIDNVYYSNKSKHLTNYICKRILAVYGMNHFEYYVESEDLEDAVIIEDETVETFFIDETQEDVDLEVKELLDSHVKKPIFTEMTVPQLKAYAKENGIKLVARRRDDIIDELNKA
jgi:hypothetical protein